MDDMLEIDSNHTVARFSPDKETFRGAAGKGFRSVVNFRTEDEKQNLSPEEEKRLVEEAGLTYLHYPVSPDALDNGLVDDFRHKLSELPTPVLMHCASGKRASAMTLMALAAEQDLDGDAAIQKGRDTGIDLSDEKIGQFVRKYADQAT